MCSVQMNFLYLNIFSPQLVESRDTDVWMQRAACIIWNVLDLSVSHLKENSAASQGP